MSATCMLTAWGGACPGAPQTARAGGYGSTHGISLTLEKRRRDGCPGSIRPAQTCLRRTPGHTKRRHGPWRVPAPGTGAKGAIGGWFLACATCLTSAVICHITPPRPAMIQRRDPLVFGASCWPSKRLRSPFERNGRSAARPLRIQSVACVCRWSPSHEGVGFDRRACAVETRFVSGGRSIR
jgi:hypothetical protein